MSSNSMVYKITGKNVDVYIKNKHKLPCITCMVRATCFSEKQATKRAKYLKYTVGLKTPCPEAILIMDKINTSKYLVMSIYEMEAMNIDKLFDKAVSNFNTHYKEYYLTSFYQFQTIVKKNPNYLNQDGDSAYWYFGMMYNGVNKLDAAIEHFTKAIELNPNHCLSFEGRGFCWEKKGDFKNALIDFKKAKKINPDEVHPDIDEIIKRVKDQISGN